MYLSSLASMMKYTSQHTSHSNTSQYFEILTYLLKSIKTAKILGADVIQTLYKADGSKVRRAVVIVEAETENSRMRPNLVARTMQKN
jgi:hypothetical protein